MKIAKIFLPLSVLALVGIILATVLYDKLSTAPDEGQLAYGLSYIFFFIINLIPMILFALFGIAILICEVCLFAARNKFPALTAALILMSILLPVMLFSTILSLSSLAAYSTAFTVIIALSMACYFAALIAVYISYFKVRALRKKESEQN